MPRTAPLPGLTREPNVVPMIDVLLVLLIIFMLAQAQVRKSLELQLPQDAVSDSHAPSIVLSVDAGARYSLNSTPIAPEQLRTELQRIFRDRPEKVLFVRGASSVKYQQVITALDAARGAGVRVTGIVPPRP